MSDPNPRILPAPIANAGRVIAFAKANGFPGAEVIYWDQDNPEYGMPDIETLTEDGGTFHITLGISLNAPAMECRREWDEGADELGPVIYQNDQRHPFGRERQPDEAPNHTPTNEH